mmetsp:Transcript_17093/g.41162  ORF Transcript_17093/g.41162 Transcript_17093/m.41162 type:complete len:536 (-) Transcript_17093:134-1741(-)
MNAGEAGVDSKFGDEVNDLKTGRPQQAATGLIDLMCVDETAFREGQAKELKAIEDEVRELVKQHIEQVREVEALTKVPEAEQLIHEMLTVEKLDNLKVLEVVEKLRNVFEVGETTKVLQHKELIKGPEVEEELKKVEELAKVLEVEELLDYILNQGSSPKWYENGIRDEGRDEGTRLEDFVNDPSAKRAGLSKGEVMALRLYTTSAYRYMNNPLRDEKRKKGNQPCPLPIATSYATEGIKKLRALTAPSEATKDAVPSSPLSRAIGSLGSFKKLQALLNSPKSRTSVADSSRAVDSSDDNREAPASWPSSVRPGNNTAVVEKPPSSIEAWPSSTVPGYQPGRRLPPTLMAHDDDAVLDVHDRLQTGSTAGPETQDTLRLVQNSNSGDMVHPIHHSDNETVGVHTQPSDTRPSDASNNTMTPSKVLWRGMRDLKATEEFLKNGGTELAFMSTTTDIEVALRYSLSKNSLLLRILPENFMAYGADLQWVSAFPGEAEVLYPPLTYLKPTGRTEKISAKNKNGQILTITVIEVKPAIG